MVRKLVIACLCLPDSDLSFVTFDSVAVVCNSTNLLALYLVLSEPWPSCEARSPFFPIDSSVRHISQVVSPLSLTERNRHDSLGAEGSLQAEIDRSLGKPPWRLDRLLGR